MPKKQRRGVRCCECMPIHITAPHEVYVAGGVLYVVFWSGNAQHAVAVGPAVALELIEMAKRAMIGADVIPLMPSAPAH